MRQSPYAYVLGLPDLPPAVFTWPNAVKKYIRDTYSTDGELHLPPPGRLTLYRYKVNPKAGHRLVTDQLDIEVFLAT